MCSISGKHRWYAAIVGLGAAIFLNLLPTTALAQNLDCTLIVPANPLTAKGLATPYQLVATIPANGPCNEANAAQGAFVQGAVLNLDTGEVSIYDPLVIDQGTTAAVAPVTPTLPKHHVVALWFGFDGNNLTLQETNKDDLLVNLCTQGLSQYAYCNAETFYAVAQDAIDFQELVVPPLGKSPLDGQACPSVRSFDHVDQDQSDNVTTTYLMTTGGQFAQNTSANRAALTGATVIANPSDNLLLNAFVDPALQCNSWMEPDLADSGAFLTALPLNELQAQSFQAEPIAQVPLGDPMTNSPPLSGTQSLVQVNRYRRGVYQQRADNDGQADTTTYCKHLRAIQPQKIFLDQTEFTNAPSVIPAVANSLFTFMAQRYVGSYSMLNCANLLGLPVNVSLTMTNGVVTGATFLNN